MDLITHTLAFAAGAAAVYAYARPKLALLARLTDRDERGRFKR